MQELGYGKVLFKIHSLGSSECFPDSALGQCCICFPENG